MLKKKELTWVSICQQAQTMTHDRATVKVFFEQHFQPEQLLSSEGKTTRFMTGGYYEPLLMASYTADERFKYPIYRTPADFFYGTGEQAEQWAGRMKQDTQFYKLVPK